MLDWITDTAVVLVLVSDIRKGERLGRALRKCPAGLSPVASTAGLGPGGAGGSLGFTGKVIHLGHFGPMWLIPLFIGFLPSQVMQV